MKAHRTDPVSLSFGLLFVVLAAWWLVARLLGLALPPVGWFVAGALLLIGILGLVGALRASRTANPAAAEAEAGSTVSGAGPGPADDDRR
ncbi:hypothetical protein [Salinispora arenicola]|uniref:hypothetical protein n=1 Tax=Salinispora arenicola TaxID=168697 RepID=UPI0003119EB5|nr:hypothetical protein [Salinispora arenicola]NIL56571.1 hypothetical protein [Salinispora arenicola]NIL61651.1 hypothetical protein [Salinispora arenicola]